MNRERYSALNKKLDKVEEALNKRLNEKQTTNEAIPALLLKIAPLLLKDLPAIASKELPDLIGVFEKDALNDNAEKIDALNKFKDACEEVGKIFKDMQT